MRKIVLLLSIGIFGSNCYHSQNKGVRLPQKEVASVASKKAGSFIDVNVAPYPESGFTPLQLVKDVLISSGTNTCLTPNVSNVQVSPNLAVSNANRSWGYFHRADTTFPFKDGIVLSTGHVSKSGNIFVSSTLGDNLPTGSDPDLVAATSPGTSLNDAVILEFDFVPTSSQVKFNYLFASEEYTGTFPCSFSDAFALLLKPVAGGPYVNMAILPGGAGPVSVTNIRPATQFDGSVLGCGAVNPSFFGGYNNAAVETNFNGRTIPLTATATVVPGQAYHFKLVLADATDSSYDSAVFLEGGSFNIGVELLDNNGAALPSDINVCDKVPTVLTASVNDPIMTYQWYYNGTLVPGATTNSITAIEPGTYTIEVSVPGNSCPGTATIEIHGGTTPLAQDATFLLCSTPDITTFDLNATKPLISPNTNAIFQFYVNQADALAQNNNYITNVSNFNGNDGQLLYVVVSDGIFCSKMVVLTLQKETTPIAQLSASSGRICAGESVTLTSTGGTTYQWNNFSGSGNTQTVTLHQTTTFTVYALGPKGCKSLQPATVTVEVIPEITSPLLDVEMCIGDRVTLDAGAGNNYTYLWSTGATTQTIIATELGIYTVIIDNGICEKMFTVKVQAAASPFVTNVDYSNNTLTITAANPSVNNVQGTLEYSIDGITWQDSNIFSNLTDNTNYIIHVRLKGTTCEGTLEFFTVYINNVITPNQDGVNDVINLSGIGNFNNFDGEIYDRYGSVMFRFTKENPIWDGTLFGKRLPTATYWYKFNFQYNKSKTNFSRSGWIMLKNRE